MSKNTLSIACGLTAALGAATLTALRMPAHSPHIALICGINCGIGGILCKAHGEANKRIGEEHLVSYLAATSLYAAGAGLSFGFTFGPAWQGANELAAEICKNEALARLLQSQFGLFSCLPVWEQVTVTATFAVGLLCTAAAGRSIAECNDRPALY